MIILVVISYNIFSYYTNIIVNENNVCQTGDDCVVRVLAERWNFEPVLHARCIHDLA